jgi:hypothetical protein
VIFGRKRLFVAAVTAIGLVTAAGILAAPAHAVATWQTPDGKFMSSNSKTNCVYPANSQQLLAQIEEATGTTYNCVLLYNNAKPTWSSWVNDWWVTPPSPNMNFVQWKNAEPGRMIVVSQSMVPGDAPSNWRVLGAEGAYDGYAVQLARNLISQGLGNSVIRLGWEANYPGDIENALGSDPSQYADWAQYWANIATSMRSVPGADFQFDWTVNQYYQPIPLSEWYPGNAAVNIIGIDAYDGGVYQSNLSPAQRWQTLRNETDGLNAVAAFAQANGKPMSIPEWGLMPTGTEGGGGDDPTYVAGTDRRHGRHPRR